MGMRLVPSKWRKNRRRSVFITLFVSYVVILLLPVLLGALFYTNVEAIMIGNANRSNAAMLEQAKRIIDSRMKEIDNLTTQIAINPKLQWLLDERPDDYDQADLYKFVEFVRDLSRYSVGNGFIDGFYVYLAGSDTILSPTLKTDSKTFYEQIHHYNGMSYRDVMERVWLPYQNQAFAPAELTNGKGITNRVIMYSQSLPLGEKEHVSGSLHIQIDERQIQNMLANIEGIQSGDIYIFGRDGQMLMSTSEDSGGAERIRSAVAALAATTGGGHGSFGEPGTFDLSDSSGLAGTSDTFGLPDSPAGSGTTGALVADNAGTASAAAPLDAAGSTGTPGSPDTTDLPGPPDNPGSPGFDPKMMVTATTSEQNGWTYVSVVPRSVVLSQVYAIKLRAAAIVLLCLAGGGVGCYYMANRNYDPIRQLLQALVGGDKPVVREKNEFEFIKQAVSELFDKEKDLQTTISRHLPVIRSDFLLRLIRGYVDPSSLADSDLAFMGIRFEHEAFAVIIIDIDDCSRFIREDTEREWALIRFIVTNLSRELLPQTGYPIEMERSRMVLLVNPPAASDEDEANLRTFVETLRQLMKERFRTKITIAVSSIQSGMDNIGQCYSEAVFAIDYKVVEGQCAALYYKNIPRSAQSAYHYPQETEIQLTNYVRNGDWVNAERILEQIYEINFRLQSMTPELVRCLFFDLLSTLIKLLGSLSINRNALAGQDGDPVRLLDACVTAEEMQERTKRFYRNICDKAAEARTGHGEQLYVKIVDYVERHYHDGLLSLTVIADQFGLTPSYVSAFFKKYSGQNLTDYLARIRVVEAKRLLVETSLTVSDIAGKVGYSSNLGLIRMFKKFEGITPGQYRDSM